MASIEPPDTDSASSSVTLNNSSSPEFHENLNAHKCGNIRQDGHGSGAANKSVPPDFIPIRSSWRSSSVVVHRDNDHEADEDAEDGDSSTSTNANDSPLAGSKITNLRDREIRGETGSMKESKTFAFGLKHYTDTDVKGMWNLNIFFDTWWWFS